MRACMEENGMQFSEEQIHDLTSAMFEDADTNNRGAITYEALKAQLEKHGGLLENLSIRQAVPYKITSLSQRFVFFSIDRWLVPPKPKASQTSCFRKVMEYRPYQLTKPYFKNNYVYLIFVGAFTLVNLALFISRAIQYRHANTYTILARACGKFFRNILMYVFEQNVNF